MGYYLNVIYNIGTSIYDGKMHEKNTSLVDAGSPLGATAVVTPGSAGYLLWECCILASL